MVTIGKTKMTHAVKLHAKIQPQNVLALEWGVQSQIDSVTYATATVLRILRKVFSPNIDFD